MWQNMKLVDDNGTAAALRFEKPFRDVLQRWRISLASLLFFILVMMDNSDFCMKLTNATLDYVDPFHHTNQCLPLTRDKVRSVCSKTNLTMRTKELKDVRLDFCHYPKVVKLFNSQTCLSQRNETVCKNCLFDLMRKDEVAEGRHRAFRNIVDRYDCGSDCLGDSNSNCSHCSLCKDAYKQWLCSSSLPYYLNDTVIPPCKQFCLRVQQTCPFLRPKMFDTHAGDPAFLCKDSLYGPSPASSARVNHSCYEQCHFCEDDSCPYTQHPHPVSCYRLQLQQISSNISSSSPHPSFRASSVFTYLVPLIVTSLFIVRTFMLLPLVDAT